MANLSLRDASDDYRVMAMRRGGATAKRIVNDLDLLERVGHQVRACALAASGAAEATIFTHLSPAAERLTLLMVEAIDSEFDPEAWAVIRAAALGDHAHRVAA